MQTEIAGVRISYKNAEDLKAKVGRTLDSVQERLAVVEKERRELLKQQRVLQKFLGIALEREPKVLSEIQRSPTPD